MERTELEALVRTVLAELTSEPTERVRQIPLQTIAVTEQDRFDTGNPQDRVYTHDLFTLAESPRLGAGLMEMTQSTFDWTLQYDEIDYVISGALTIHHANGTATARAGELILIPKGSKIQFSAPDFARFLYVTYPADWQSAT
jgi:ethanolamine utilization protein EutQ